jgi:hypothetical protein
MTMESPLVEWPRRHYVPGGKHPFLFYVVYWSGRHHQGFIQ